MTRFNTGNPLSSLSEEDFYDNSMALDEAMNSTESTWRDRFGVEKPTIDAALKSVGFMPAGFDFVTGGTLQPGDRNKAVYNPAPNGDNNWYRWNGTFPKEIAANSQPNPKDENNWVPTNIGFYNVSVRDFGATGTGVIDDSQAFTNAWEYIKRSLDTDTANLNNVSRSLIVPPGVYFINKSIDWTKIRAWNIHVDMRGAVLIAGSGCAGFPIIDATDVRGLHIEGGYIESTLTPELAPSVGLLIGPTGSLTCGNNNFRDLKIMGVFGAAPYVNIGSETTYHWNCYFAQTNTNLNCYSFIGDGTYTKLFNLIKSQYTTLRPINTPVSFTNNKFYGCHFRNYGGGSSVYLRYTSDWGFDSGCYNLAFNKSNFEIFQSTTQRNTSLSIEGLMESTQQTGVKYTITFIIPDGEASGLIGLTLKTNTPHAKYSVFNSENEQGGVTTGTLVLGQAKISLSGRIGTTMLFNNCGTITITGEISCRVGEELNLFDLYKFIGTVSTRDGSKLSGDAADRVFNFILFDETTYNGQVLAIGKGQNSYLGVQNGLRPVLRAEGTSADVDLMLQAKGEGKIRFGVVTSNPDAPIVGYVSIKDHLGTVRRLAVI